MTFRWPKFLPRFPAILLMPTVLALWTSLNRLVGFGWWSNSPLRIVVIDASLAVAAAWALAMAVERLVFPLVRRQSTKKFGWPRFLPRLPTLLLMPAFVFIWVSLLWFPESSDRGYERGYPLVFEEFATGVKWVHIPRMGLGSLSFPAPSYLVRSEFRLPHFMFDLAVALVVAYLVAMAVDRLLFPLVRRLHRKKPEQGEPG